MGLSPDVLYRAICSDLPEVGDVVFDYNPTDGSNREHFASAYLKYSIIRKWIPSDTTAADRCALDTFTASNKRCMDWRIPSEKWEIDRIVYGEIRRQLDDFFHPGGTPLVSSLYELNELARPGPGAAYGAVGTSYYTKFFCSSLTSTSEYLYEMYRHYAARIPTLSDAECQRYESYGRPSIVSGSRCSFVPKTASTSRMICVEPLLNSYYQLGLCASLEARLRQFFGIDLSIQPSVNHSLAKAGSIDGSYATIDLSAASDSISLGLCEWLLPSWLFELLLQLRSRTTLIDGKEVPLFMISTMGNGFTFPLQTIIFSAVLKAVSSIFGKIGESKAWSCFGDDLICRTNVYDRVVYYLGELGFRINADKSYSQGPFRESCGADWFCGQPVRPVFIRKLDSPHDVVVAINQLNEWTAYTGVSLTNTISCLYNHLEPRFRNPVPYDTNMDSGIRVPSALCDMKYDANGSPRYRSWTRQPSKLLIYEGKIRLPGRKKDLPYNPSGLYCSFLWGELTPKRSQSTSNWDADFIAVRHDSGKYRLKPRCSPSWDYIPTGRLVNGTRLSWQQWETAVMFNMLDLCGLTLRA